jgi:hypothetical protein
MKTLDRAAAAAGVAVTSEPATSMSAPAAVGTAGPTAPGLQALGRGTPGRWKRLGGAGPFGRVRDQAAGRHRRPPAPPARPGDRAAAGPARRHHLLPGGHHRRAGRARLLGRWVLSLGRPGRTGIQPSHHHQHHRRPRPAAGHPVAGGIAAVRRPGGLPAGSGFASL